MKKRIIASLFTISLLITACGESTGNVALDGVSDVAKDSSAVTS